MPVAKEGKEETVSLEEEQLSPKLLVMPKITYQFHRHNHPSTVQNGQARDCGQSHALES